MTGSRRQLRTLVGAGAIALGAVGPAQDLTPKQIHQSLEVLMTLPSRQAVRVAVGRLGGGGKAVVPELTLLLHDPRLIVRTQVYRVLGDLGRDARAAVPMLLRRTKASLDSWERVRAAQLALKIDPDCVKAMHILGRSRNMNYRSRAARRLGETPGGKNVDLLADLIDDDMGGVRTEAFDALVQHGEDAHAAIPKVIDAMVGRHAKKLDPEDIPGAIHSRGTALDDAGRALGSMGEPAVAALLKRHAKGDAKTQLHCLNALGGLGARRAQRQAIRISLLAADAEVRKVAFGCLMSLEVTDCADLTVLLTAYDRFGSADMHKPLVRYLHQQGPTKKMQALRKAFTAGDAKHRRTLVGLLPDLRQDHRTRHRHTELFLSALRDRDATVRHAAAMAIKSYRKPDPALRAPLLRMRRGTDIADRRAAEAALRAWRRRR